VLWVWWLLVAAIGLLVLLVALWDIDQRYQGRRRRQRRDELAERRSSNKEKNG
jgi:beta-lactamase regulating signal transducer with metallopeptidase domain